MVEGNVMHVRKLPAAASGEMTIDFYTTFSLRAGTWQSKADHIEGVIETEIINRYRLKAVIGALFKTEPIIHQIQLILGKEFNDGKKVDLVTEVNNLKI